MDLGVLVLCNVLVYITRWTKSYQSAVHTLPFVIVLCLFDLHMLGCPGDDVFGFVKHIPFVLCIVLMWFELRRRAATGGVDLFQR